MTQTDRKPHAIIVMGVSGSGKTSVGRTLAEALSLRFIEGDELHPPVNVEKMSRGIALTDEDRAPWLDLIGGTIRSALARGEGLIVSCSALKRTYRERLRSAASGNLLFVYLEGSPELLTQRMGHRTGHFMPASLLESQLATLEAPTGEPGVVTVAIGDTIEGIAGAAQKALAPLGVV
jgi:gluconokinase